MDQPPHRHGSGRAHRIDPGFAHNPGTVDPVAGARAFQFLYHRLPGKEPVDLDDLVRDDPEMLDLALGLLFHYDPA